VWFHTKSISTPKRFQGGGWGNKSPKYVPQLKFPEGLGVGGEGSKTQNAPWEGFGYFLEQHHLKTGELA